MKGGSPSRCLSLLIVFLCCGSIQGAGASNFVQLCSLSKSDVVSITYDVASGTFVLVDDSGGSAPASNATSNRQRQRFLRTLPTTTTIHDISNAISISTTQRRIQQGQVTGEIYQVRECTCAYRRFSTNYCPADKDTCGIPRESDLPVGCFTQSSRTVLIRNAWPVIVLWYAALAVFLLFTEQGRNARHYVWSRWCNRNLNNALVDQFWYTEGGFWRMRRRRFLPPILLELRRAGQPVPPLPNSVLDHLQDRAPNQLALKTKRYVASTHVQGDPEDSDDVACTICFSPLEDGDRVGALPCNHVFHVDCLKTWLPRRNVCPLCQAPDVAAPRYQPIAPQPDVVPEGNEAPAEEPPESSLENQGETSETPPPVPEAPVPPRRLLDTFRGRTLLQRR